MKKNFKKLASLFLSLALVFSLAIPAFAVEAEATPGTVTVSVTINKFTKGGIDEDGIQSYIGGTPTMNDANGYFYILNFEVPIADVEELAVEGLVRDGIYNPPEGLQTNVLDAIITALYLNGYDRILGGWDANPYEGLPGGYIYDVSPQTTRYDTPHQETVDGVLYDVFTGNGWNVACTQDGALSAVSSYATSIPLTDGMEIVFDISDYAIYSPVA